MSDVITPKAWPASTLAQAHAALTAPGSPFETTEAVVDGQPMQVWKNAPATVRDVFINARSAHGDKTFLVYQDERATFEAFARATLLMAQHLAAMGVVKGDRVAVAMRNLPEWPVAVLATLLLGGIATPLNAWGTGPELAYCVGDAGAKVLVVDAERWARLQPLLGELPALQRVIVARAAAPLDDARANLRANLSTIRWESLLCATNDWATLPDRPLPAVDLSADDHATLLYTSGPPAHPRVCWARTAAAAAP